MTAIAQQPEVVKTGDLSLLNPSRLPVFNGKRVVSVMAFSDALNVETVLDATKAKVIFTDGTSQIVLIQDICKNIRRLLGWQLIDGLTVFVNSLKFTIEQGAERSQKPLICIYCNPTSLPQSMSGAPYILVYPKYQHTCGITTLKDPYVKKVFEQN